MIEEPKLKYVPADWLDKIEPSIRQMIEDRWKLEAEREQTMKERFEKMVQSHYDWINVLCGYELDLV